MPWESFLQLLISVAVTGYVVSHIYEKVLEARTATVDATQDVWESQTGLAERLIERYENAMDRVTRDAADSTESINRAARDIIAKNNALVATAQAQLIESQKQITTSQERMIAAITPLIGVSNGKPSSTGTVSIGDGGTAYAKPINTSTQPTRAPGPNDTKPNNMTG